MTDLSFKPVAVQPAGADTRDRVFVRDLAVFAHHGVFESERQIGQYFHFDIECALARSGPWLADDPQEVVRYDHICDAVVELVQGEQVQLIETLAERIAARLFERFARIAALRIVIRKPHAAIAHQVGNVGVEIMRERQDVRPPRQG